MLHFGMYLVGANIYDIWQIRRNHAAKKVEQASLIARSRRPRRALVSVIVPAHNEEMSIEKCLDSIRNSSYKVVEIIVHNDNSTDDTARIVRSYRSRYPKLRLRLVNRRHQAGKGNGVSYCIKRYAKGKYVMTLDADTALDSKAIENAVSYFADSEVMGVAANVRIHDKLSVLGMLQKFEHMIGYRSKKFYSITNSEFIVGGVASTFRREVLERVKFYDDDTMTEDIGLSIKIVSLGNHQHRLVYGVDVVAHTEGVHTLKELLAQRYRWKMGMLQNLFKHRGLFANTDAKYSRMLTMYRIPMAYLGEFLILVEPLVLAFVIYVTLKFQDPALVVGAYGTISLYTFINLWFDEHTQALKKLKLSFLVPLLYFMYYIMNLVQVVSMLRCLGNYQKITQRKKSSSDWISPKRLGQQTV
jgi:cellulose synthase/poly-beta-1,6-N-acetylglucosamine synthase-like glycosyltransferase